MISLTKQKKAIRFNWIAKNGGVKRTVGNNSPFIKRVNLTVYCYLT